MTDPIMRMVSDPVVFSRDTGFPHVVAFIDHFRLEANNLHFLVMEYCEFGTLLDFLNKNMEDLSFHVIVQLAIRSDDVIFRCVLGRFLEGFDSLFVNLISKLSNKRALEVDTGHSDSPNTVARACACAIQT